MVYALYMKLNDCLMRSFVRQKMHKHIVTGEWVASDLWQTD